MKKKTLILLLILIAGVFFVATPVVSLNNRLAAKSESNQISETPPVTAKIAQDDPRGYLTGRMFFQGHDGTNLKVDVEVQITSTVPLDCVVMAALYDRTFQRKFFDPYKDELHFENGYHLWGNSSFQNLEIGTHNMTVHFNCTQLRALKLAGPYAITHVQLANGTLHDFHIFDEEWTDDQDNRPLLLIPGIFDIFTFDEPQEAGTFTVHDAILTSYLEVNITFQSYYHWEDHDEPYYIRLVMRNNAGGPIIGHWEQTFWLESNKMNEIRLTIPVRILGAFDFGGVTVPTISFEEVAIVELHHRDAFDTCNMSYASSPHSASIDISGLAQVQLLTSGSSIGFGDLAIGDRAVFGIHTSNTNDVLHLEMDRIEPVNQGGPDFDIWCIDGFGRSRDPHDQHEFVNWEEWMENIDTNHYMMHIGKYPGTWIFEVRHNDHGQPPDTTQGLAVRSDIAVDLTPPSVSYTTPSNGDHYLQYYGIPIQGIKTDDASTIIIFQVLLDQRVLEIYKPLEWYWGDIPIEEADFKFIWFPDHDLAGSYKIVIRAFDLTSKFVDTPFTITIDPGTKPSPESTINKGLEWLRTEQNSDGSWDYEPGHTYGRPGMAALAGLCFIQAGLAHESATVEAINYLMDQFDYDPDDGRSIYHSTYETSMATITLIAYNATLPSFNSELNSLIEDAIAWLVVTQNDETWNVDPSDPWYGGWRYGDDHQSSDLSVSQWVILALSTYENFNPDGLDAYDPFLWDKVDTFVRRCRGGYTDDGTGQWVYDGGFTYTPSTEDWREWGGGSYGSMTAAGIWGLYLGGSEPDDPDIISALDWINNSGSIVGENPHSGFSFEYYWYLSASKAFLMAGRESDQWWYDKITEHLNTHMIYVDSASAYWDNTKGGEPPVYATVLAILSQQVYYGHIPMHTLEVTLESIDGSSIYLWNSTINVGYNYTTGQEESSPGAATYAGLLSDIQKVTLFSPSKGEYFIDVFPAAGGGGMTSPQDIVLRARALTESGHTLRYRTHIIDYSYVNDYPQVLRYKMVLTTISGLDIHFLFDGFETFARTVNFDDLSYPTYVDLNQDIEFSIKLTNIGLGTISTGTIYTIGDAFSYKSQTFTSWDQSVQNTFSFIYGTSGLSAGIRTIVIVLVAEDTTPLLVRFEVQVGNRVPVGELDSIDPILSGTEQISWTASDPDGDDLTYTVYLVLPDGSRDILDSGITKTSYYFDTTAYPDDGGYKIIVEISDGTDSVELESSFFAIQNEVETSDTGPVDGGPQIGAPGFELIFSLLALSLILIYIRRRK